MIVCFGNFGAVLGIWWFSFTVVPYENQLADS